MRDEDSGRNAEVRLSIVAGNGEGKFRIDPTSGMLYVAKPLDAETKTRYTLTVAALDQVYNSIYLKKGILKIALSTLLFSSNALLRSGSIGNTSLPPLERDSSLKYSSSRSYYIVPIP